MQKIPFKNKQTNNNILPRHVHSLGLKLLTVSNNGNEYIVVYLSFRSLSVQDWLPHWPYFLRMGDEMVVWNENLNQAYWYNKK